MHLMRAALARERQAHGSQAGLCRWPVLEAKAARFAGGDFLAAIKPGEVAHAFSASPPRSRISISSGPLAAGSVARAADLVKKCSRAAPVLKLHHDVLAPTEPRFGRAAR